MDLDLKNENSKKRCKNLYCQLFCQNVPLRQSSDVLNELLLYDVGWRLSLFAQARPDEWVSGSRNFRVSHITRIPTHSCESHRMFQRLWMSAIMSDILHILMSPPPVSRLCTYHYLLPILFPSQVGTSRQAGKVHPAYGICGGGWRSEGNTISI